MLLTNIRILDCLTWTYLCVPDVHTFVKRTTRQIPAIRTESYTVHRLLVFCQSMDANSSVYIPQSNSRIKGCTDKGEKKDFISNEILSAPPPIYNIQPFLTASHGVLMRSRLCCQEESVLETKLIGEMAASLRASPSL